MRIVSWVVQVLHSSLDAIVDGLNRFIFRHQLYDQGYFAAFRARTAIKYADELSRSIEHLAQSLLASGANDYPAQVYWDEDFKTWERLMLEYTKHAEAWTGQTYNPMDLKPIEFEFFDVSSREGSSADGSDMHRYKTVVLANEKYAVLKRDLDRILSAKARPPRWRA